MRNSNFEMLRIVAILCIVMMHSSSFVNPNDYSFLLLKLVGAIGNTGVSCFILISGYYGIRFRWEIFLRLVYLTTIYSIVVTIVNEYENLSLSSLAKSFLVVPLYNNWFITCYLILMLLSPFLNDYISKVSQKSYKRLLMVCLIVFSIIPTLFNSPAYNGTVLAMGGKCITYMIFLYLLGRYIKLYHDKVSFLPKRNFLWYTLVTMTIFSLNVSASFLFHKPIGTYAMDCSTLILVASVLLFYLFKSLTFQSQIVNYVSSSVIAVYLLDGIRIFLNNELFHIAQFSTSYWLPAIIVAEAFCLFIIAIFIDKIRILILGRVENKILEKCRKYCFQVQSNIEHILTKFAL